MAILFWQREHLIIIRYINRAARVLSLIVFLFGLSEAEQQLKQIPFIGIAEQL
jgi:hypothetical protein